MDKNLLREVLRKYYRHLVIKAKKDLEVIFNVFSCLCKNDDEIAMDDFLNFIEVLNQLVEMMTRMMMMRMKAKKMRRKKMRRKKIEKSKKKKVKRNRCKIYIGFKRIENVVEAYGTD